MKKPGSLLVVVVLILNSIVFSAFAEDTSYCEFKNIDSLRTRLYEIFEEDYDDFFNYSSEIKELTGGYEYFTYNMNCGACSYGFRKLLYQHSLVAECMCSNKTKDHMYNIMRVSFSDTPDKISTIIVDTTYKQYLTAAYDYDYEKMDNDLPPILIYEYNNKEQLYNELESMKKSLGLKEYESLCNDIITAEIFYPYPVSDLQELDHKTPEHYNSKFIDDLRNNGRYEKKLSDDLYISGADTQFRKEMEYSGNGIYRCYLSTDEASALHSGFTVTNGDNKTVFGANDENETLKYITSTPFSPSLNNILLMKNNSEYPLILDTYGTYLPILLSIDFRAGENTPAVYAYTISRVLQYGDVDTNGDINICDVTALQKACAKMPDVYLDVYAVETADVLKIGTLNILNATEISRYLAKYDSEKCGRKLYFSPVTELSLTTGMGYIEI